MSPPSDRPRLRTSAATAWANWMLPRLLRSGFAALRNCGGIAAAMAYGGDTTPGNGLSGLVSDALRARITVIQLYAIILEKYGVIAYNSRYTRNQGRRERAISRQGLRVAHQAGATRVPARTGISRRRGACARLLLPAQYAAGRMLAEKLHTAAAAGRANTLGKTGAPRRAAPRLRRWLRPARGKVRACGRGEGVRRLRAGRPPRRTSVKS